MTNNPRVMTLDEVITADFVHLEFHDVIWEDCAVYAFPKGMDIRLASQDCGNWYMDRREYNDSWRCWTDVPTWEQMKEEPWGK